jgi:microcystin-dependent protein
MARSYVDYTGNGVTTNRAVPFSYIDQDHVKVKVDGVVTAFTWVNAGTISISPAPANGTFIHVYRESSPDARLVDYNVPGTLTEEDLDNDSLQAFFMAQEAIDTAESALVADQATGQFDAAGRRIVNLGDPVAAQDAATKAYGDTNWGGSAATSATASAAAAATSETNADASEAAAAASAAAAATSATNAAASAATALARGLPVGAVFHVPGNAAPAGSLKINGALLSRVTYVDLWTFAQASGCMAASDAAWLGGDFGKFSPGDGSTNFRLPDLRGYHVRSHDDGRGIDSGRVLGSVQADDNKAHTHTGTTGVESNDHVHGQDPYTVVNQNGYTTVQQAAGVFYNSPVLTGVVSNTSGVSANHTHSFTTASTGSESRPKNIALLACIKY